LWRRDHRNSGSALANTLSAVECQTSRVLPVKFASSSRFASNVLVNIALGNLSENMFAAKNTLDSLPSGFGMETQEVFWKLD
jgi:hypothetical protein